MNKQHTTVLKTFYYRTMSTNTQVPKQEQITAQICRSHLEIQRCAERKAGCVNVALETQALLNNSQQLTQTEIKEQLGANFSRKSVCYANLEIPTTIKGFHDSSHFPLANINRFFGVIALLMPDPAPHKRRPGRDTTAMRFVGWAWRV